jgi:hypothetical protein
MVTKLPKIGPSIKTWLELMLITWNWRYEVCFKSENVVMILIVNMDKFIKEKLFINNLCFTYSSNLTFLSTIIYSPYYLIFLSASPWTKVN